jgi:hypothetical protein
MPPVAGTAVKPPVRPLVRRLSPSTGSCRIRIEADLRKQTWEIPHATRVMPDAAAARCDGAGGRRIALYPGGERDPPFLGIGAPARFALSPDCRRHRTSDTVRGLEPEDDRMIHGGAGAPS